MDIDIDRELIAHIFRWIADILYLIIAIKIFVKGVKQQEKNIKKKYISASVILWVCWIVRIYYHYHLMKI